MRAGLTQADKKKVSKPLLWIGMASILMAFAGLTSGYVVSRTALIADNEWLQFALPQSFFTATIFILLSTLTMVLAQIAVKKNRENLTPILVGITLVLGILFAFFQYSGWRELIERGLFFTGEKSNTAVSWVYVITGLHWLHVISGLIVLGVTLLQAARGKYTKEYHNGLSLAAIFWHFLDGLWIYIYLFLVFIR